MIKTKRFQIKKINISNVNLNYFSWFKDPYVKKFILYKPIDLTDLKKNVEKKIKKKNSYFFGIFNKNKHIGNIFFDNVNKIKKEANIGILIGEKKFRGQGVGYEATKKVIEWIHLKKKINKIYLGVNKKNLRAIELYKKLNFIIFKENKINYYMLLDLSLYPKIVLGTAQFTNYYGITNFRNEKVETSEIKKIFNYCKKKKIFEIDTSCSYPVNLKHLPKIKNNLWKINTKISLNKNYKNLKYLKKFLIKNFIKKSISYINILYIHKDVKLTDKNFVKIYNNLKVLKKNNLIKKIGISIYDFNLVRKIINKYKIDALQVPYNVIDRRFENFEKIFNKKKIEIYARSVFLQGVLVTNKKIKKFDEIQKKIDKQSKKNKVSKINYCINFVYKNNSIKKIILGFQNFNEIYEVLKKFKYSKISYNNNLRVINKKIIDPRTW